MTLDEAIQNVLHRLSLAAGIDTQLYAEDRIQLALQHKFDVLFDHLWWPQFFTQGASFSLDGTTGKITTDVSSLIKRWVDIQGVWYESYPHKLPRAPITLNPSQIKKRCIAPVNDATKVFKLYPVTTTGTVYVNYRTKPDNFVNGDDDIDLDDQLLICGTCYDILEDEGSNPAAADKFKQMFDARLNQLEKALQQFDIAEESANYNYPTEWHETYPS